MKKKGRLDQRVVEEGLAQSRALAQAYILEGKILVNGVPITKAGTAVRVDAEVQLRGDPLPYVSRGGLKLEHALREFRLDPAGWVALDGGASTGGFTDCLLQRGAGKVYAVDVGHGQLSEKLRRDPRVVALERTNLRHLDPALIPDPIDLITLDLSFISLDKIWPALLPLLRPQTRIVTLVKPQFEAGRRLVRRGGRVTDPATHRTVLGQVVAGAEANGLQLHGLTHSPLKGPAGNLEFFALFALGDPPLSPDRASALIQTVVETAHATLTAPRADRP